MKVRLMSDLHWERRHLEFPGHLRPTTHAAKFAASFAPTDAGEDVLVLAGDIFRWTAEESPAALGALKALCARPRRVLYVPGNHEYYRSAPQGVAQRLKEAEAKIRNLSVLRTGEVVEVDGQRFLGDTMWFPRGEPHHLAKHFSDFRSIRHFTPWVWKQHQAFRSWLEAELQPGDVVVTHHAPSAKSTSPQFLGDPYNIFFVSPMDDLIEERQPVLWLHGHVHSSHDYLIGSTRVVCNPLGYSGERQVLDFEPQKVVEF